MPVIILIESWELHFAWNDNIRIWYGYWEIYIFLVRIIIQSKGNVCLSGYCHYRLMYWFLLLLQILIHIAILERNTKQTYHKYFVFYFPDFFHLELFERNILDYFDCNCRVKLLNLLQRIDFLLNTISALSFCWTKTTINLLKWVKKVISVQFI